MSYDVCLENGDINEVTTTMYRVSVEVPGHEIYDIQLDESLAAIHEVTTVDGGLTHLKLSNSYICQYLEAKCKPLAMRTKTTEKEFLSEELSICKQN